MVIVNKGYGGQAVCRKMGRIISDSDGRKTMMIQGLDKVGHRAKAKITGMNGFLELLDGTGATEVFADHRQA